MDQRKRVPGHDGTAGLLGRSAECAVLDQLIAGVRTGESRVLVVHGVPGVGKSALLEYAENAATGMRVLRAAGVESEMELAYATLHQLCLPMLDRLKNLPEPQREALETVFGTREGTPPERFLVGLAVLSLLSDASEGTPLLCLVDDAQWMDRVSAQVLGFVARRLLAESVALVVGSRRREQDLIGLPELEVTGLKVADAHALLNSVTHVRIDPHVRDRFVAETRGNPLALLELPRELSRTAGGPPDADTLPGRIERSFLSRIEGLPEETRLLLLVAAAEPTGNPGLVWAAAERLGVTPATALTSGTEGLLEFDVRVIFRHPLVRSAVYRSARPETRRAAHLALAQVTDAQADPDRRAWHLACAVAGPDEDAAAELERSAGRAQARGGLAAAAAFLQRSVTLTVDTSRRAERALAAADASLRAGDIDAARQFADLAGAEAQDDFQRARAELVRSHLAFAAGFGDEAPLMLLAAARRLEAFDLNLARETYLVAWGAASFGSGNLESLLAVSRAMGELPPSEGGQDTLDLVLTSCARVVTGTRGAALPALRGTMDRLASYPVRDQVRWGWLACAFGSYLWEDRLLLETPAKVVEEVRAAGALTELPIHLHTLGVSVLLTGDCATGTAIVAEVEAVAEATGVPMAQHTRLLLRAMQGREEEAAELIAATVREAGASGQMGGVVSAHWAASMLYNGLARYELALPAARATIGTANLLVHQFALSELVEAAARAGDDDAAHEAVAGLADLAEPCDTDWAQGMLARCRAMVSADDAADDLFREAIERLGRTLLRPELARAHLLYGEWLRRDRRRTEARANLRTAYEMFVSIGMDAFAERARRELLATGENVRRRRGEAAGGEELTPQERQIAQLVRDGLTNPEVGARLFVSPRTVEWHLRKVFVKLGIGSRAQLRDALAAEADESAPR